MVRPSAMARLPFWEWRAPRRLSYVYPFCPSIFASRSQFTDTMLEYCRYGPAPSNADSAINILLDVVQDQSGKTYKMDHYQTRYPTNVLDIAGFLVRLSSTPHVQPPPILHYTAPEPFTKYEICLVFARILGSSHKHIIPQADEPARESTTFTIP